MGLYEELRDCLVAEVLEDYGIDMTLKTKIGEVFNAQTGTITTTGSDKPSKVRGLIVKDYLADVPQANIRRKDKRVIVGAKGLTIIPDTSYWLVIGTEEYAVVDNTPLQPGGVVVMHELLVRK